VARSHSNDANEQNRSNETDPTLRASPVLVNSRLAAVNWTDNDRNTFQAVFWQAEDVTTLMMSIWDSANRTWEVVNITQAIRPASAVLVDPAPGTSLAAASNGWPNAGSNYTGFRLFLVYQAPNGTLQGLNCLNPRGSIWGLDGLTTATASTGGIAATPGTQISIVGTLRRLWLYERCEGLLRRWPTESEHDQTSELAGRPQNCIRHWQHTKDVRPGRHGRWRV
jgi:hypothetical protein